jgi:tryptophan synthase
VAYLTAGYPVPEATIPAMLGLQAGGANIIELGIPFSDPIADGPVIQEASHVNIMN